MDNFSYQLHIIPDRISQLTVLNYKFKHSKKKMQILQLRFWGLPAVRPFTLFPMKYREISLLNLKCLMPFEASSSKYHIPKPKQSNIKLGE